MARRARNDDRRGEVEVAFEAPDQPDVRALIDALDAYQKPLYPPESHHGIDLDALSQPEVRFAVAREREGGRAIGCGAVVVAGAEGELKRMYVVPAWRGRGVAQALLAALEGAARAGGCTALVLETGVLQHEAIGLYRRSGFERCAPFGAYVDDPLSVFMRKVMRTD